MAVNPTTAVEQGQQLDLLASTLVPTGVTESPVELPIGPPSSDIDQEPADIEVAGLASPLARVLGRLLNPGGTLEETRQRILAEPDIESAPRPVEEAGPEVVPPGPRPVSSEEELLARVRQQSTRIRPTTVEANEILRAALEPQPTNLVSGGLRDFTAVGARGDPKIPDEGSILALIEQTSLTYRLDVDDATRKVITHEAQQDLADALGVNPQRLMDAVMNMRGPGQVPIVEGAGLSETVLAVRNLLYTEVSKLDVLAEAAKEGDRSALLNFRQQLEVVSNLQTRFKGIQTEIGRSLGAFRIPVGHAHPAYRDINLSNMLQEFGGAADIQKLAGAYLDLPTTAKRVQFTKVSLFKKFTNAAFEVWMNNLLSGPITHTKNFVAAGVTVFMELPVGLTAATIGSARRLAGGEGGVTYGDVHAEMFGRIMALREALSSAATSWRSGQSPIAGSKLGDSISAGDSRRAGAFSAEAFEMSRNTRAQDFFATSVDAIGGFLTLGRAPTRALGFEDTFWKVVAQRGSLWGQAYRSAREQDLSGDAAAEFMANFISNPPAAAIQEADDLARKLTLQTQLETKLGRVFQGAARVGPMRWFVPFIKTPYNAFSFAFEHTPLARFTKNYQSAMESGNPARIDVARARVGLGSAAGVVVASMAAVGEITGGGPADPGLRANLRRQDWQPYSILIDGTYYSYAGGEPYSTIIGLVADATELVQTGLIDQDAADEIIVGTVFSLAKNLSNKTFMQGFANFVNAMTSGERYAERVAKGFTQTLTPVLSSSFMRQAARAADPYRRDPPEAPRMPRDLANLPLEIQAANSKVFERYPEFAWLNQRLAEIKANVPGWSETVPALRDFWGKKVPNEGAWGWDLMSPVYVSVIKDPTVEIDGVVYDTSVLDEEMYRLKIGHKGHPGNQHGFPMSEGERDFYQERAGIHAVQFMTEIISDADYQENRSIGVNQRADSPVNKLLRSQLQQAIRQARLQATKDLVRHETLGDGFQETYTQMHGVRKSLVLQSFEGD